MNGWINYLEERMNKYTITLFVTFVATTLVAWFTANVYWSLGTMLTGMAVIFLFKIFRK